MRFDRRLVRVPAFIFGLLLFLSPCLPASAADSQSVILLGSSKREITPEPGTPLSGYGKLRGKKTAGTHDPLYARSISLSRGRETFVFLSLDLCLIDQNLRKIIHRKVLAQYPLEDSHLVITATHTHSGAGAIGGRYWERFIMGKFRKDVFEKVTDQARDAVLQSLSEQFPVKAEYGEIRIDDLVENRMITKLRYPQKLKALRFRKTSDNTIAAQMVFMAAHPTLFPAKELLFSADYPGILTSSLESASPESTVLFINGAAGDMRPHAPDIEERKARLTAYGQSLVSTFQSLSFSPLDLDGPWKSSWEVRKLPHVKARLGFLTFPSVLGGRVFPRHAPFQSVRFGPLLFLCFPGEVSSEIGDEIESRVREAGLKPLFTGYANDYMGYVIPRRYYNHREEYEARVSFYGPGLEWFFQEQADRMIDAMMDSSEKAARDGEGHLGRNADLPVLILRGSAYHRGYEEGRLLKKEIRGGVDHIFSYFRKELKVPLINRIIINRISGKAWKKMSPFVSYDEYRQIQGVADGSGIPLKQMLRIHALPELYPALCSNGAYWGEATEGGRLVAIRNLDWNRKMGVQSLAAVKVFRSKSGPDVVNIGYGGFTGVLSGMNSEGISVGQIGAESSDETMKGVPMPFLLKRVLEESSSLVDAEAVFKRSDLTRGYNYVIADAKAKKALVAETSQHHLAFFHDDDPKEKAVPYALSLKDAVFRGDTALDPDIRNVQKASKGNPKKKGLEPPAGSAYEIRYLKHGQLIQKNYGKITPDAARLIAKNIAPGSNIQSVIFAFPDFWVANAEDDKRAVDSAYHAFNLEDLLQEETRDAAGKI